LVELLAVSPLERALRGGILRTISPASVAFGSAKMPIVDSSPSALPAGGSCANATGTARTNKAAGASSRASAMTTFFLPIRRHPAKTIAAG
jgi:hypothetical protein